MAFRKREVIVLLIGTSVVYVRIAGLSTVRGVDETSHFWTLRFENDVKTYGTQTLMVTIPVSPVFENDVKTYGTQTQALLFSSTSVFENDVKTYGTQTRGKVIATPVEFENDVKTYGTQT